MHLTLSSSVKYLRLEAIVTDSTAAELLLAVSVEAVYLYGCS
jgi:hypothetical protein